LKNVEIVVSNDGSHTLCVPQMNETYHSVHGAITESLHVYIGHGFNETAKIPGQVRLLEVGFGTGLNALLTWVATHNCHVYTVYHTIEPFPLSWETVHALNYVDLVNIERSGWVFEKIHKLPWNMPAIIDKQFEICKFNEKLENLVLPKDYYNLVYFDAFAPDKQPALWTSPIFEKLYSSMTENGILVTYSAKGSVKRALKGQHFIVESLSGPIGKREMTRARKMALI